MKHYFLLSIVMVLFTSCAGQDGNTGRSGNGGAVGDPGASGPQGAIGNTGPQGPGGADGSNGSNGSNGTVITPIQFCPGVTPTYPSTFPELGLCINNQLYGVYSANDGFLVLLTPGTYSSNGINASCTFTILPNCVVQ